MHDTILASLGVQVICSQSDEHVCVLHVQGTDK